MYVSQIDLISAISDHLERAGVPRINQRQMNAIIRAATDIVEAIAKEHKPATDGMGLVAWLDSDDTGLSSRFMAMYLSSRLCNEIHWPHDPDDFGRCYRLLQAVPELRDRLPYLENASVQWAALVKHWSELESLWVEESPAGAAPKLYARMRELLKS